MLTTLYNGKISKAIKWALNSADVGIRKHYMCNNIQDTLSPY